MKTRTLTMIAATAIVALGLAGCATEVPRPPTATTDPTPTQSPSVEASSIIVSSETVTVLADDDTELASYGYFEPSATQAIDGLTEWFGFAAEITEQEAVSSAPRTTIHQWQGFELWEYPDVTSAFPETNTFRVVLKTASVDDIAVSATGGIAVGMEETVAAPLAYRHTTDTGGTEVVDFYRYDETPVETDVMPDYEPAALSINVWVTGKDRLVTRIDAPSRNWGT